MDILKRAPTLGILAALVSGAALYDRAGVWSFLLIVPVMYCAVMFCSYEEEWPEQWRVFVAGLVLCGLCSLRMYCAFTRPPAENITLTNSEGTVQSVRSWGRIYAAIIDADNGERYVARLQFASMMPGDRIAFDGVTQSFRPRSEGSDFDEARFWGARGVSSWVKIANYRELPARLSLPRMRYLLSRKLTMYMPPRVGAYLKAAWIGERDNALNELHRKWGTVHILAVSGFHVGIVMLCVSLMFGTNSLLLSVILWGYVLLSGAAPSASRAGLMIQVALISRALGRPVNGVNTVSVAGVSLLMYSPLMFWDVGFRLSLLSALVISTLPRYDWMLFVISPVISLVTFPQISRTFGEIVLVGLVLNILAPTYFAFALTIASGSGILRLMNVPLMNYVMVAVEGIFLLWERTADFFARAIPYSVGWNYLVAWAGTGTLIFCLCRYFKFAPVRVLVIMIAGSLAAFVMFR